MPLELKYISFRGDMICNLYSRCTSILNQTKLSRGKCSFRAKNTSRCLIELKLVYSYVIEVADSESDFGLHIKALVSEILLFILIRLTYIFN